jgi:hypothetical protein
MLTKSKFVAYASFFFLLLAKNPLNAQSTPNPCSFSKINCGEGQKNVIYTSFFSDTIVYAPPGRSMPFWFAFGDSATGIIDTTDRHIFSLTKSSGPGDIHGNTETEVGYYAYVKNISFSEIGTYKVLINAEGGEFDGDGTGRLHVIVPPEDNFCADVNFGVCDNDVGNQILAIPQLSTVVPVDEVMPIKVGVVDSSTGFLDSTFSGTIYVDKVSGPGELYGILSMTGGPWFNFNFLHFSEEGFYTIRFFEESLTKYKESILNINVVETVNGLKILPLSELKVYPNPFDDEVVVRSNMYLKGFRVLFSNYLGQTVLQKNVAISTNKIKIDTSDLGLGVYFMTLTDSHSLKTTTFKLVK